MEARGRLTGTFKDVWKTELEPLTALVKEAVAAESEPVAKLLYNAHVATQHTKGEFAAIEGPYNSFHRALVPVPAVRRMGGGGTLPLRRRGWSVCRGSRVGLTWSSCDGRGPASCVRPRGWP